MSTTAEGVETQQQRQIAEASGCSEIQGFLFSTARQAKDLAELLSPVEQKPAEDEQRLEPFGAPPNPRR